MGTEADITSPTNRKEPQRTGLGVRGIRLPHPGTTTYWPCYVLGKATVSSWAGCPAQGHLAEAGVRAGVSPAEEVFVSGSRGPTRGAY